MLRECDQERISGKGMEDRIRIVECPKESFLSYNYLSNSQKMLDGKHLEGKVGESKHSGE